MSEFLPFHRTVTSEQHLFTSRQYFYNSETCLSQIRFSTCCMIGRERTTNGHYTETNFVHLGPSGFATFANALREARCGKLDRRVVQNYQDTLAERLETSKSRLQHLHIPNSVKSTISPLVKSAESLFEKLGTVLDLVDEYLYEGSGDALEEAISLLDLAQSQVKFAA